MHLVLPHLSAFIQVKVSSTETDGSDNRNGEGLLFKPVSSLHVGNLCKKLLVVSVMERWTGEENSINKGERETVIISGGKFSSIIFFRQKFIFVHDVVHNPYLQRTWDSWHPILLKAGPLNVDELHLFCLLKKHFHPKF